MHACTESDSEVMCPQCLESIDDLVKDAKIVRYLEREYVVNVCNCGYEVTILI